MIQQIDLFGAGKALKSIIHRTRCYLPTCESLTPGRGGERFLQSRRDAAALHTYARSVRNPWKCRRQLSPADAVPSVQSRATFEVAERAGRSKGRSAASVIIIIALLAGACSSSTTTSAPVEPGPAELPPAFSTVRSVGDVGLYYANMDGQMRLIAFDAATRTGRYQVDAHPLGRVRGVRQTLIVDSGLGLVFVTGMDDESSEDSAYLRALDAASGAEVWKTSIHYRAAQPRDCGSAICVRSGFSEDVLDKATGELRKSRDVSDRRVFLDHPELVITAVADGRDLFVRLEAWSPSTGQREWTISANEISEAVGTAVDPGFGWAGLYDVDNRSSIVFLASANGRSWTTIGANRAGQITWARTDLDICVESPFDKPPVVCKNMADPTQSPELVLLNAATGEEIWTVALDSNFYETTFDGTDLIVWSLSESGGGFVRIAAETGESTEGVDSALCTIRTDWGEFELLGEGLLGFASEMLYTTCGPDGTYEPTAAIAATAATLNAPDQGLWLVDSDAVPLIAVEN